MIIPLPLADRRVFRFYNKQNPLKVFATRIAHFHNLAVDPLDHGASSLFTVQFLSYFGRSQEALYGRGWKKNW